MKLTWRSRLTIFSILIFVILAMVVSQSRTVRAAVSGVHAFMVVARVETEIMQKTPAGLYYEGLFWKHNDELMRIMSAHPENTVKLRDDLNLFIPGLEALVDGKGETVVITNEQVNALKEELDWFSYWGSPVLKEDIERERQRIQLDHLVGMTMDQALEYVNTTWMPDSEAEKTIVPNSDGKWAYFILQDIYFEYPSQYFVQVSESDPNYVYLFSSTDVPEQWHPYAMKVKVWTVPPSEDRDVDLWYAHEDILWETPIQTVDFHGFEYIKGKSVLPVTDLHAFLYNQSKRLAVEIFVFAFEAPPWGMKVNYPQLVNENYEYFQHMVDNIRMYYP